MRAILLTEVAGVSTCTETCQVTAIKSLVHNNPALSLALQICQCVGLQGVSIINEKCPTVSGFLRERSGTGGSRGKELRG